MVTTTLALIAARGRLPGRIGLARALPFGHYRLLAGQVAYVVEQPRLNALGPTRAILNLQERLPASRSYRTISPTCSPAAWSAIERELVVFCCAGGVPLLGAFQSARI